MFPFGREIIYINFCVNMGTNGNVDRTQRRARKQTDLGKEVRWDVGREKRAASEMKQTWIFSNFGQPRDRFDLL